MDSMAINKMATDIERHRAALVALTKSLKTAHWCTAILAVILGITVLELYMLEKELKKQKVEE